MADIKLWSSLVTHDNGNRATKAGLWIIMPSTTRTTDRTNTFKLKLSNNGWDMNYDYEWTIGNYCQYYNGSWNNWRSYTRSISNGDSGTEHKYWDNNASETARHDPYYLTYPTTVTKLRVGEAGSAQLNNWTNKIAGIEVDMSGYKKYAFADFQVSLSHCTGSNYRVTYAVNDWATTRSIAVGDIVYCGEKITCDLTYDSGYEGPATYTQEVNDTTPVFTYTAEAKQSSCYIYVDGWKQAEGFIYVDGWKSFEPKIYVDGWKGMG